MDTEIKNTVVAAADDAQYDEKAKKVLGNKYILAHILIKTVDEFKGMNPEAVVTYIEGEPKIGVIPTEPGMTNISVGKEGQKIVGFNTEDSEINEGLVRFDIVFYVRMKDGLSQIIVNLEAQKSEPTEYDILNRAVFYVSRLISSQKGRDFVKTNYNDIRRCFSIWVCMNMDENTMSHIRLAEEALLGTHKWKGRLDLVNIVMLGIAEEPPEHDDRYDLHRLLGTLFSKGMSVDKKLNILETEYEIPVEDNMKEDLRVMCNLSQGIRDDTKAEVIMNMYRKGYTVEQIADVMEKNMEDVKVIIANKTKEPALV